VGSKTPVKRVGQGRGVKNAIITYMEKLIAGAKELGLELTPARLGQFATYHKELLDWNSRVNLTAITSYEEVQLKHFLDSLTIIAAWPQAVEKDLRVIDVGTGAGLPGIPLKIAFPAIKLTLLEATAKKADFLRHIVQKLGLDGVEVVDGRAEEVAHQAQYREKFDLVLSRAVASLPTLVELALPFCAVGGSFIAQKKGTIDDEISRAGRAINLLGGSLREVKEVALPAFPDERYLVIIDKLSPTPEKYPRRPGMPAKRPLA
jgi:16S rRNA (guanine527-N7)-methyltransferase